MGSFDYTCSVTRTAIHAGDPVLAVWTNVEYLQGTYDLLDYLRSRIYWDKESREMREKIEKILEDEGLTSELKEFKTEMTKGILKQIDQEEKDFVKWKFGTYDDYGFIEEDHLPEKCDWFLVHAEPAKALAGMWPHDEPYENPDFMNDFLIRLCTSAYSARIQLFGHQLLGVQFRDVAEMKHVRKVGRLVTRWQRRLYLRVLLERIGVWYRKLLWDFVGRYAWQYKRWLLDKEVHLFNEGKVPFMLLAEIGDDEKVRLWKWDSYHKGEEIGWCDLKTAKLLESKCRLHWKKKGGSDHGNSIHH